MQTEWRRWQNSQVDHPISEARPLTKREMPSDATTNRISGLEALIKTQGAKGLAPVERWDPPYCGDIGLRIRSDGVWLYRDSPIGRPALVKLFADVLRKDADGRHYLVTPVEKIDVAV